MFFSGLNMRRKHDPDLWLTFMKPLQKICYASDDYIFLGRCGWVILLKSHEPAEHGSSGAVGVQHPRLTKPGPLLGPQRILSRDQKNTSEELLGQPWIVTWTWNLIICFTHEICICKHIIKYFKIQWKPSCAKNSVQGALRYFWKIWQWTISTNHWEHPNLSGVMWVLGASPKMSLSQGTRWRLPQAMFVGKDHATSSIYLPQTRKVTYL